MADVSSTFSSLSSTESNTANGPAGSTTIGSGLDENIRMPVAHLAAWRDQTAWGTLTLTSVSGTNTITATLATAGSVTFGPTSYITGSRWLLVPANTNTGATTLNITSPAGGSALGAKNVFFDGRACVGGELVQSIPAVLVYDGTQFNILTPAYTDRLTEDTSPDLAADYVSTYDASTTSFKKVLLGRIGAGVLAAEQSSGSGTTVDFTGIPSWAKQITIMFDGVSTNGTDNLLIQLGDAGGIENTGYAGVGGSFTTAGQSATSATSGFLIVTNDGNDVRYGAVVLSLEDATNFTWVVHGVIAETATQAVKLVAGRKATSAALDRVRITVTGANSFDAGEISISYR